jgi:hypothetical protein
MNDDQRPTNDDQQPTTNDQSVYESVKDAARRMGLSDNAVRLRIKRGTLPAEKIGDNWFVVVGGDQQPTTDQRTVIGQATTTHQSRPTTTDRLVNDQSLVVAERIRVELETVRDEWLQPLIDQIRELEREAGRLAAEREHAQRQAEIAALEREVVEAERDALLAAQDALRSRVRELETVSAESSDEPKDAAPEAVRKPWWRRWFG